jgi:Tol biopolymer transport system component
MRLRDGAGLALLLLNVSRPPDDDVESTAFITAVQANLRRAHLDPRGVAVSAGGRYIAFVSYARLASADTNDHADIYVLDRTTRAVTLETLPYREDASHDAPRLCGAGRVVVYAGDGRTPAEATRVIVLRDRYSGTWQTIDPPNARANGACRNADISADGRVVAFTSSATNLAGDLDANGPVQDVFLYNRESASFSRVSVDATGRQSAVGSSFAPSVSMDGRHVAFSSTAPLDGRPVLLRASRPVVNVYVRDLKTSVTSRVSLRPDGAQPNASSYDVSISGDGRYVAFVSDATDLVRGDMNRAPDVFLFDANTGVTMLVSQGEGGASANGTSRRAAISASGTVVSFQSDASDLTCATRCAPEIRDINLVSDIFAFDVRTGAVRRISLGARSWKEPSITPAIDGTGALIAFSSRHPRDSSDDGDDYDLFVRLPPK